MARTDLPHDPQDARKVLQQLLDRRSTLLVVLVDDKELVADAEGLAKSQVLERRVVWAPTPAHVSAMLRAIADPKGLAARLDGALMVSIKAASSSGTKPREIRDVVSPAREAPDLARIAEAFFAAEEA